MAGSVIWTEPARDVVKPARFGSDHPMRTVTYQIGGGDGWSPAAADRRVFEPERWGELCHVGLVAAADRACYDAIARPAAAAPSPRTSVAAR